MSVTHSLNLHSGIPKQPSATFPVGWAVGLRRGLDWIIDTARDAGIQRLQLSYFDELDSDEGIERIGAAVQSIGAELVAITFGFDGEDWSDIPSIYRTCGLAPAATRAERMGHFRRIARFAQRLGVRRLAGHVGHIPEDPAASQSLADAVRGLCAELADAGQILSMETGQETARAMERFVQAVNTPHLAVNFDPANFILYGNGSPAEAWEILQAHVDAIHCKDATAGEDPRHLGNEARLDEGEAGFAGWLGRVLAGGFDGPLIIETGIKGDQLPVDLLRARRLVQKIVASQKTA